MSAYRRVTRLAATAAAGASILASLTGCHLFTSEDAAGAARTVAHDPAALAPAPPPGSMKA